MTTAEIHPRIRPLPERLAGIEELCLDLRWTWNHAADRLWETIDRETWSVTKNPWLLLQRVPRGRLDELAADDAFCGELQNLLKLRREYLEAASWFETSYPDAAKTRIAYFSMEYGLGESLPIYSGGLGILAGDHLKAASDLGVPVTAVGLLYQEGYFRQMVDAEGNQIEFYPDNNPGFIPIAPARDSGGAWMLIPLELPGRRVLCRVWSARIGRVVLYLLDSNDPMNSPADRGITAKLYPSDRQTRLLQEMILGICGWRTLEAMGVDAPVCHLNEGHSAFATIERARSMMGRCGLDFWEALSATRAGNIFTTHTPVAAGFDAFPKELTARHARRYVATLGISEEEFMSLGRRPGDGTKDFNMASLAIRTCSRANGVSRLHGQVSREIFQAHFPRWPENEVPISHITNGVHVPSWDSPRADEVWTGMCGKARWTTGYEGLCSLVNRTKDEDIWDLAVHKRRDLVAYARRRLATQLAQRGEEDAAAQAAGVLDPAALTLGFARRFAEYKRPAILLRDPQRLVRLLTRPGRPVQLIIAGKAHPQDMQGKQYVRDWVKFAQRPEVRAHAVFLEDYDLDMAKELVQGVDVWINTPRRPWEACGTSGMKVLANGGLNVSELDGWWAEAYGPDAGWAIGDGRPHEEPWWDESEAEQLYRMLEDEIVPKFYDRDATGVPRSWTAMMRAAMSRLAPDFSSSRMMSEYVKEMYLPAERDARARAGDGGELARDLWDWERTLRASWPAIRFDIAEVEREGEQWRFTVYVDLGELDPSMVRIELFADATEKEPAARHEMLTRRKHSDGREYRYRAKVAARRPWRDFTPRAIPFHPSARIPSELPLILWHDHARTTEYAAAPARSSATRFAAG